MSDNNISRRRFLKILGAGGITTATALTGCSTDKKKDSINDDYHRNVEPPVGKMTYRTNSSTGDKVSILGYGMMRLPTVDVKTAREAESDIDQETVNRLVDYAIEHGVNYFDTSPAYCKGLSERSTGTALKRHPRKSYFIATKLSNFSPDTWSREASIEMFRNSLKELQTDYIDYYLLHGIGMGGMEALHGRYIDNGMLDYLVEQRSAGHIRNLGFSYHGDVEVYDFLLSLHDKYRWDFVQIELNYLDWDYADEINPRNTDASYLYEELRKRDIPAVIMEPLLGGRLADVPQYLAAEMKRRAPEKSVASWAFRYAGSPEGVLTVLSGMTYMEHLKDNLLTYCPLNPVSDEEKTFLHDIAGKIVGLETIPCNDCKYCMPCPYGINIPAIFTHYNKCKNEGTLPRNAKDADYNRLRREYLIGLDRSVPRLRQADHCIGCGQCVSHCPQNIKIPHELHKISDYVERLKRGKSGMVVGNGDTDKA
ncbi:MAG: aldo/keto reductase [Prevotella sp.]|nr:aldo/keto reductase [Prevotella sp.]